MNAGQLFEELIRMILSSIGFSQIKSDGLYLFDGAAGQMIQGLGQAHNADVLMEPPAQTPFYFPSRLLLECKNYNKKRAISINIVRSALGLREDINSFELIDINVLKARRNVSRIRVTYDYNRYYYQVGVAALGDFSIAAQEFALAHRIPLISFNKMPFWASLVPLIESASYKYPHSTNIDQFYLNQFYTSSHAIAEKMAVAILADGQMLLLYYLGIGELGFAEDSYQLLWNDNSPYWRLVCGDKEYAFQLPDRIKEAWMRNSIDELSKRKNALLCKEDYMSHLVVYYKEDNHPKIKLLSIDKFQLEEAYHRLNPGNDGN